MILIYTHAGLTCEIDLEGLEPDAMDSMLARIRVIADEGVVPELRIETNRTIDLSEWEIEFS